MKSIRLIGDASYSRYLFHPYVMKGFNKVFHVLDAPGPRALLMAPLTIGLCFLVAIDIYRLVEQPMTDWLRNNLLASPSRTAGAPLPGH